MEGRGAQSRSGLSQHMNTALPNIQTVPVNMSDAKCVFSITTSSAHPEETEARRRAEQRAL